jgi:hypothetical protein
VIHFIPQGGRRGLPSFKICKNARFLPTYVGRLIPPPPPLPPAYSSPPISSHPSAIYPVAPIAAGPVNHVTSSANCSRVKLPHPPPPPQNWLVPLGSVSRWPKFRPNKSKRVGKKCSWQRKNGGRILADFCQEWQKRGQKFFFEQRCCILRRKRG